MAVHRGRRLEDWVELAAAAVAQARGRLGDEEVAARRERAVPADDYETTVRTLRVMGRELQSSGADLTALDARLRGHAEHAHVPEAPEPSAPADEANPEATLADLPPDQRTGTPMELARKLARLRNPILPHPGRRPGKR